MRVNSSGVCSSFRAMSRISLRRSSLCLRSIFFSSSRILRLLFGVELLVDERTSRCLAWMSSTACFIRSMSRRFTISVNSILRIARESSTRARPIFHFARRNFRLSLFATSAYFSSSFVDGILRQTDAFDLFLELPAARVELLVGDLLFVEHDEFADRALAAAELRAEVDDLLRHARRPRDRLDDGQLALLDALGNRHFALAREQRHRAHLAQVHADRVVRLVERTRRQVEVHLLAALALELVVAGRPSRESTTSIPALPNVLKRSSSSSDDVRSAGRSSFTSSYRR